MTRHALFVAALIALFARSARADETTTCRTRSVRVSLVDAGSTSMLEISARVAAEAGESDCRLAWSRIVLSSSDPSGTTPNVALVEAFVDHERARPLVLAAGLASARMLDRVVEGVGREEKVVALRALVEDTDGGLKVDLPLGVFPPPADGARIERRVKSARDSTGKFGPIGEIALPPSPPGPAGGLGPTGPFDADEGARFVVECAPTGAPPSQPLPAWATVLDGFRATLPLHAIDLSPANDAAWDDLARHAYAAALHSDPVVASLGVSALAWLANGLDVQGTKLDASVAPKSVVEAIGDVKGRLDKRYGAVGELLVLGRPSTFRRVLPASPSNDAERVKAAKASVARLASLSPADVAAFVTPPILETTAPVDPPAAAEPSIVMPSTSTSAAASSTLDASPIGHKTRHFHPLRSRRARRGVLLGALGLAALVAWIVSSYRRKKPA